MLLVNYMRNNSSVIKSLAQKGYYIAKIKYKRYNSCMCIHVLVKHFH